MTSEAFRAPPSSVGSGLVTTGRAAQIMGVSPLRVRQMIEAGKLPATNVSGRYMLRVETLRMPRAAGRPLSHDVAWDVLALAAGKVPEGLTPRERAQRGGVLEAIARDEDPARGARTLLAARARRHFFASVDPSTLLEDDRVAVTGALHPSSGISIVAAPEQINHLQGYVHPDDLAEVRRTHMLGDDLAYGAVVILDVTTKRPGEELARAVVAVDLAESIYVREQQVARDFWAHAHQNLVRPLERTAGGQA